MPLATGQCLTHYEILGPLGAGGMGEVYRARDTRLDREVAIKLLPENFADDEERLRRLEREAKTLASLNHPNVAGIHGIDHVDDTCFLAMELVPGEDLAAKLARGPLPVDEAVDVCRQIADGLEAAHEAGVVHRDLKPANVRVTPDGVVKILDFGLAKPIRPRAMDQGTTAAAPDSFLLTEEGLVLGTPTYMSPEQARGKPVDKRTDVWAFGCVFYECLTGKRAFGGESLTDVMAAIVDREPDWRALPATTPSSVRHVLDRCLDKDPRTRLRDVGEARIALSQDARGHSDEIRGAVFWGAPIFARGGWVLVAVLLAVVTALVWDRSSADAPEVIARFTVSSVSGATPSGGVGNAAISPDGHAILFVGSDEKGRQGLWLKPLDRIEARFLPGTEDAKYPFWSPSSDRVAFFAGGELKRVILESGRVDVLCGASDGRGGSWSRNGVIVFSPAVSDSLWQVDAEGGTASRLTRLDPATDENGHRFPYFLPDGQHYTFLVTTRPGGVPGVDLGRLGSDERRRVVNTERAAIYADPGYLIFAEGGHLVAQRLTVPAGRLVGHPTRLVERLTEGVNAGDRVASVSANGLMVLPVGPGLQRSLVWLDRRGYRTEELSLPQLGFSYLRVSPDGGRAALYGGDDVWVSDFDRGTTTRVTFSPANEFRPVWSPDGGRVAFTSNLDGPMDVFAQRVDGSGETVSLFASPSGWKALGDWSQGYLAFHMIDERTGYDIWIVPDDDARSGRAYLATSAEEMFPRISPDGRWLAYQSNESGRFQVYVQSFPEPGVKMQVTTEGGESPFWSREGDQLFFVADGVLSAAPVTPGDRLTFGAARGLFQWNGIGEIDQAPDGRFVTIVPDGPATQALLVVVDWALQLER